MKRRTHPDSYVPLIARASWIVAWLGWDLLLVGVPVNTILYRWVAVKTRAHSFGFTENSLPDWANGLASTLFLTPLCLFSVALLMGFVTAATPERSHIQLPARHRSKRIVAIALYGYPAWLVGFVIVFAFGMNPS